MNLLYEICTLGVIVGVVFLGITLAWKYAISIKETNGPVT
jgi:hypothetical protein